MTCDDCEVLLTSDTGCVRVGSFRYCEDCAPEEDWGMTADDTARTDGPDSGCWMKVGFISEERYCGRHGRAAGWPCTWTPPVPDGPDTALAEAVEYFGTVDDLKAEMQFYEAWGHAATIVRAVLARPDTATGGRDLTAKDVRDAHHAAWGVPNGEPFRQSVADFLNRIVRGEPSDDPRPLWEQQLEAAHAGKGGKVEVRAAVLRAALEDFDRLRAELAETRAERDAEMISDRLHAGDETGSEDWDLLPVLDHIHPDIDAGGNCRDPRCGYNSDLARYGDRDH